MTRLLAALMISIMFLMLLLMLKPYKRADNNAMAVAFQVAQARLAVRKSLGSLTWFGLASC